MRVLKVLRTDTLQANFFYFIFHEPINKFEEIDFVTETTNHTNKIYRRTFIMYRNVPTEFLMCRAGIYRNIKDNKFVYVYTNICVLEVLSTDTLYVQFFYFFYLIYF